MELITIKIKDNKALKFIQGLEDLDLIQVMGNGVKKPTQKLSSILSGSISDADAENMHKELQQMRNEWERNI